MESQKIFPRIFSHARQEWITAGIIKLASRNIPDFTKVLSRNIYFGTESKKSRKFFCHKSLELYGMPLAKSYTVGRFFRGLQILRMVQKGVRGNYFHEWHWWCVPPLFTIHVNLRARYTPIATLEDIMADKLAEERIFTMNYGLPSLAAKPFTRCPLIRSYLSILISSCSITW